MSSIWETVEDALAGLATPKAAGSYQAASGADLPDTFLVYTLVVSSPEQHSDDLEALRSYLVQISLYSRSGLGDLPDTDTPLLVAGFTKGSEREIPYNPDTRHYGLALEYYYLWQSLEDDSL